MENPTNKEVAQGIVLREVYAEMLHRAVTNNYFDREHPVRSTHIRDIPVEIILKYYVNLHDFMYTMSKDQRKETASKILDQVLAELYFQEVVIPKGVPLIWKSPAAEVHTGKLVPNKRVSIICCDFDGVLHSYTSGWMGATVITDDPVPGAMAWLADMAHDPRVQICVYSSRSKEPGAIEQMKAWLLKHLMSFYEFDVTGLTLEEVGPAAQHVIDSLEFPIAKPAANMTIDDRAFCFEGRFPNIDWLLSFKPWNKRPAIGPTCPHCNTENHPEHGCLGASEGREACLGGKLPESCMKCEHSGNNDYDGRVVVVCNHPEMQEGMAFLEGGRLIDDLRVVPAGCPLRKKK